MAVNEVGSPDNPQPVGIPGGTTTLAFSAQEDSDDSDIDVTYTITGPNNIEFSTGGKTTQLKRLRVRTTLTRVPRTVGFRLTSGTLPDGIDIKGTVDPDSGEQFEVFWTVPIQFVAASPTMMDASSTKKPAKKKRKRALIKRGQKAAKTTAKKATKTAAKKSVKQKTNKARKRRS